MTDVKKKIIVLFVEGDTEKEFYDSLISFYRKKSKTSITKVKIYNLKGIGRFERKVSSKIKHELLPTFEAENIAVFCCYDSDVFELAKKPPTNWKIVENNLKDIGIFNFNRIIAVRMIEDWFLLDLEGLMKFLKLKKKPKLKGNDAHQKIKILFKLGKKIYQKGNSSHKFIDSLNINKIRELKSHVFKKLEKRINYTKK